MGKSKNSHRNNHYNNNNAQRGNNNPHYNKRPQHQNNRVEKKKPAEQINHSIKAPLFDKSKLIGSWQFTRKIGPGFINGQNTCFLNSVLQCLTYTPALAQELLKETHKKSCKVEGYCALCAMELHVRRSLKDPKSFSKGAAILPSYYTSNLKAISKTLRLGRQEDAHEFYMFLLSAFQKGSIAGLGKLAPKVEETAFINQVFGGKLRSQLKCFGCKATSNNFEACLDLSVDLQKADTLKKALDNFINVDKIDGYKCDSCKQIVKASKQMTLNELPLMLTIHLKRFAFDLQRGYMRKIGTHIAYPQQLDMTPYTSNKTAAAYDLYAILVHLGYGCESGHYFAYVKAPNGQWFRMDDEDVQPVSLKEIMSQNAYMLFYQKVDTVEKKQEMPPMPEPPVTIPPPAIRHRVTEKRVVMEPAIIADHPGAWVSQSTNTPLRSLRGNLSPPTYAAHVRDAWQSLTVDKYLLAQKLNKRRVFRKKLESRKALWKVNNK